MMLKLEYGSTISCQSTFGSNHPFSEMVGVTESTDTKHPNYKEFISPIKLRRLSPILRMSLATAIQCKEQVDQDFDAIVVGTALGCLRDTEKFLEEINANVGMALSPTSFIQSTHNTISGQVSLFFKNHSYNMTHSQLNLSFELSLLDCMNTFASYREKNCILLGAADEKIDFLEVLQPDLIPGDHPLTEISSSFIVQPEKSLQSGDVAIENVLLDYSGNDINTVLQSKQIDPATFDLIMHSGIDELEKIQETEQVNYLKFSGLNYVASAFATHFAFDRLLQGKNRRILIVNNLCKSSTGFIILRKID